MTKNSPQKIGVDWGSSSFRAYLFDSNLQLIDSINSGHGIKSVQSQQFESIFFELIGHWLTEPTQVLLSGMVTSRNGWIETPYLTVPASLNVLHEHAVTQAFRGSQLHFLPGLCQTSPRADVIRGEELQLIGATKNRRTATVVMPGTHSKWAKIHKGSVTRFQTIMTGELFDVLINQTLVGQLADGQEFDKQSFTNGVRCGYNSTTLVSELFQCRSGVLLEELDARSVHSYLSGLLIGNEISEGLTICTSDRPTNADTDAIVIVGSDNLCERYSIAFESLRIDCIKSHASTTANAFAALLATINPVLDD